MVNVTELKKGMTSSQDGKLMRVLESNHYKSGKGNTVMQIDLRDVRAGPMIHKIMRPSEKVELVKIAKKDAQHLYAGGDNYIFMDTTAYEQYEITRDQLGGDAFYLVPNTEVQLEFTDDDELIGIELPATVIMKVVGTQPEIKGAIAVGSGKPATMETGLVVACLLYTSPSPRNIACRIR